MALAVQQRRQGAQRDAGGLALLLGDAGQPLAAQAADVGLAERRVAHDIGEQVERRLELVVQRVQRGVAVIQPATAGDDRAQTLLALGDLHRIEVPGAFVEHRHGEAGGAQLAPLVGGVTGVEQQLHLHRRHRVAFGQHHLDAVVELAVLQARKTEVGEAADLGHALAAIDVAGHGLVIAFGREHRRRRAGRSRAAGHGGHVGALDLARHHGQGVIAPGDPLVRHRLDAGRRGRHEGAEVLQILPRITVVQLALGQDRGLRVDPLQTAHERGAGFGLDPRQLVGGGAVLEEFLPFVGDGGLDLGRVDALLHVDLQLEQAGQRVLLDVDGDAVGELVPVDQPLVQPRGLAAAEHGRGQLQHVLVMAAARRHVPFAVDARLRHVVGHRAAGGFVPGGDPRLRPRHLRAGGDVAEILQHLFLRYRRRDVAGQHHHRVGRAVVVAEPLLDVAQRGGVQIRHRADGVVVVGMVGRERLGLDQFAGAAVGLVFALALLVLHHTALLVELRLADGAEQVAHAVRLHPQRHVQRSRGHGFEIVGAVEPGGAVLVGGAGQLERLEELILVILRTLEHQVLEQMREAGLALGLVGRADVIPDAHRHHGRLVVFMHHHGQAVGQHETGIGQIGDLLRRCSGGLDRLRGGCDQQRRRGDPEREQTGNEQGKRRFLHGEPPVFANGPGRLPGRARASQMTCGTVDGRRGGAGHACPGATGRLSADRGLGVEAVIETLKKQQVGTI